MWKRMFQSRMFKIYDIAGDFLLFNCHFCPSVLQLLMVVGCELADGPETLRNLIWKNVNLSACSVRARRTVPWRRSASNVIELLTTVADLPRWCNYLDYCATCGNKAPAQACYADIRDDDMADEERPIPGLCDIWRITSECPRCYWKRGGTQLDFEHALLS